jgi:hypothetical protein
VRIRLKNLLFGLVLLAISFQVGCSANGSISDIFGASTTPDTVAPPPAPNDPTNLLVKNVFANQAQLFWNAAAGAVAYYKVSLSTSATPGAKCESNGAGTSLGVGLDLAGLLADTIYYFRICSASTGAAAVSEGITGTFKTLKLATRNPAYPSYPNWNDYLLNNGTKFYNANQTVCNSGVYGYNVCINGALVQKIVIPGVTSCSRIKTYDLLGVFRWFCDTNGTDTIIYSTDLNSFKGLSDLIVNNEFIKNLVVVQVDGQDVYSSTAEKWWTNVIESLPDSANGTTTSLTNAGLTSGKIFTVSTQKTGGAYSIAEDKISIVVLKNAALIRAATDTTHLITGVSNTKFIWLEGSFNGSDKVGNLVRMTNSSHSRLHNIELSNSTSALFYGGASSHSIKVSDFSFHHGLYGIEVGSHADVYFLVVNGRMSNNTGAGLRHLGYSVAQNIVFSANTGSRGAISYGGSSIFTNITIANGAQTNSIYTFISGYPLYHNILSVNSSTSSIYNYQASSPTYSQILSIGGATQEILTSTTQSPIRFTNNLVLDSPSRCTIFNDTADSPGLTTDGTCSNAGPSDATLRIVAIDQTKIFAGKVTADDKTNPNNSLGASLFGSILDWIHFESFYRHWGKDGSTFPNADNQAPCTTGTCRIWDYRLKADNANMAYNNTDLVTTKNGPFIAGATCPAAVHGNKTTTHTDDTPTTFTFLTNAAEISGDGIGNDNGLCESNDACIYTPNFGAYQGEGDYTAAGTCLFQNGTVSGVQLYAYPINGI